MCDMDTRRFQYSATAWELLGDDAGAWQMYSERTVAGMPHFLVQRAAGGTMKRVLSCNRVDKHNLHCVDL